MKKIFTLIAAAFAMTASAESYMVDPALEVTATDLTDQMVVVTDAAGEKTWGAYANQDINHAANFVSDWANAEYGYVKFYAANGGYYVKLVNAAGEFYIPSGDWHDKTGCMNVTGSGTGLFIGGKSAKIDGQDVDGGAVWQVTKVDGGYTIYNAAKNVYAAPGVGVTPTETVVKLYTALAVAEKQNLLVNSGAEKGKAGWICNRDGSQVDINVIQNLGNAHSGVKLFEPAGWGPKASYMAQTVNLPAGMYELTAYTMASTGQTISISADDAVSESINGTGAEGADRWKKLSLVFTVDEQKDVVIKGNCNTSGDKEWANFDDFCLVQIAAPVEYTVYAKVTADEQSKTFVGQTLSVLEKDGVATVTLPAAQAGPYTMASQKVKVNIDAEGKISMVADQKLNFTDGTNTIVVTVTGVEGALAEGKVNVTVTASGDNGKDVKVIYSTDEIVPDPEITILTKEMFKTWTSAGADAQVAASQSSTWCDYVMNESTGMPYGNGNVDWMQYADLSEYDYLTVTASAGTPRFFLNRKTADGQAPSNAIDTNNATHFANYVTKVDNGDGTFAFTLNVAKIVEEQGFAHLNVIKGGNWANVTVTKMELVKNPTAVKAAKAAPVKAAKVAKFFKNGKVVIVKDGKMFNVAGAQM